jgi:hypothetical protein
MSVMQMKNDARFFIFKTMDKKSTLLNFIEQAALILPVNKKEVKILRITNLHILVRLQVK